MRKALLLGLVVALILVSYLALESSAAPVSYERLVVRVSPLSDYSSVKSQVSSALAKVGGRVVSEIPEIRALVVLAPSTAQSQLSRLPGVLKVEADAPAKLHGEVQWNIYMVNAPSVWSAYSSYYGNAAYGYYSTVRVAVVDTGIDYNHPDLTGAVTWCVVSLNNGATFYKGTTLSRCADNNGHGTHVAGIIAARLNGAGVAGVAPKALLYAIKVLDASGSGYVSDIARGIIEATKGPDGTPGTSDDADVISMSLGSPYDSTTLHDAIRYAYSYGVVLVAAAGNEGASSPDYPAAYPEVLAVGAVDSNGNVPSWSNRYPDVVAPGVNILSTYPGGKYAYMSGTSMATPHVSAIAALIQALRLAAGKPKLSPDYVYYAIIVTARDLGSSGYDPLYGYGLVDAKAAVDYALYYL
ncbi:S8 family peptidase [Thermogladius sp. 4427co]|uniref:S8 family peptidase n=1 Tax=Thermogladius sp. 4427co TaxID=3450718 RepID=UPI003F7AF0B8